MKRPCCPTCGKHTTLYSFGETTPLKDKEAYRKRLKNLIATFELEGYHTYEEDLDTACAVAQIMSVQGESDHMHRILSHHMERITASTFLETA